MQWASTGLGTKKQKTSGGEVRPGQRRHNFSLRVGDTEVGQQKRNRGGDSRWHISYEDELNVEFAIQIHKLNDCLTLLIGRLQTDEFPLNLVTSKD